MVTKNIITKEILKILGEGREKLLLKAPRIRLPLKLLQL